MNLATMFSSKRPDWETPKDFFEKFNNEFHFTLDVCATQANTKCKNFFSPEWVAENKEDFIDTFNVIGEDVPIAFEKSLISPEGKFVFSTEKISQDLMELRFIKPNLFKGELT